MVDHLRAVEGTAVAALIRDRVGSTDGNPGRKVSLRSTDGRVDVSRIARAQGGGGQISGGRAAAIHECSVLASRYSQHDWGNVEIYQYRACMARHGQPE